MAETHHQADAIPRPVLIAAGAMVAIAIALAAFSQISGLGRVGVPEAEVIASKDLRIEERGDGRIVVLSDTGTSTLEPENGGFLLGIVRGLGRERTRQAIELDVPYTLTRWTDGRLSLRDRTTGNEVQLAGFGPTNLHAFARLLASEDQTQ